MALSFLVWLKVPHLPEIRVPGMGLAGMGRFCLEKEDGNLHQKE
jgi:hypothetical protein